MTVVYARFNDSRKAKYRLVTTVEEVDGDRFSFKRAASPEAGAFLLSLPEKYRLLAVDSFPLRPLEPVQCEDAVRFEYTEGDSLDSRVSRAVRAGDGGGVREVFLSYKKLIDHVPGGGPSGNSGGFARLFGDPAAAARMDHLATGCLDLILENIYEDGQAGFALIDYEWTFDFPLPRELVLLRTVMNTYFKYWANGINRLLPAGELLGLFGVAESERDALMRMEWSFQQAVNERVFPYPDFLSLYNRVLFEPYDTGATIGSLREKFNEQTALSEALEEELGHARRMLSDRDSEIASMRASKFWKLRELYVWMRRLPGRFRR